MSPSTVAPSDAGSAGRAPEVEGPTRVGSLTALALSALAAALLLWPVLFGLGAFAWGQRPRRGA